MKKNHVKLICAALVICIAALAMTACGAKDVTITVKDMGSSSEIEATTDMTVSEALENGGIKLATKDETEPAADTKITEELKEITVKRYAKVTVVFGDEKKDVELVGGTVEDAVKEAGFKVSEDIKPDAPLTDYLKDGMTITLTKGVKVELTVDGKTTEATTYAATVEAFLKEQGVTLSADDIVSEKLSDKPADGMKITVSRVTYKEEKVTEKVDYETEEKYSDSMDQGTSEVNQQGAEGEKTVTYKVKYIDGKEDSREKVSEEVTKEPVTQIITKGTRSASNDPEPEDSGSGGEDTPPERTIVSKKAVPNCDDESHGYYIIEYSDGTFEYPLY